MRQCIYYLNIKGVKKPRTEYGNVISATTKYAETSEFIYPWLTPRALSYST